MGTTIRNRQPPVNQEEIPVIRWRVWPLVDSRRWSWIVPIGVCAVGGAVWYFGGSWFLSVVAIAGLFAALWQFFLPVDYEIGPAGLRQSAMGRTRVLPWHAIRAYQLRTTGVVLYQSADPTKADLLRSLFIPYPADEDEMLCALRDKLSRAAELPM